MAGSWRERARRVCPGGLALLLALVVSSAAAAREVTIAGTVQNRFARIALTFDRPTKVKVRTSEAVVVISFEDPARIKKERLVDEVAPFVAAVRRDPDDTGLRIALGRTVRTNVLEAGERVFVDLLPQNWVGLPPGLPPDVVSELAARAAAAEAKLRDGAGTRPKSQPVTVRLATTPNLTRLVFELPAGTPARIAPGEGEVGLDLPGPTVLDEGDVRPRLAAGVRSLEATARPGGLAIKVAAADGYKVEAFPEGDTVVVDLPRIGAPPPPPLPRPRADPARPSEPSAPESPTSRPVAATPAPTAVRPDSQPAVSAPTPGLTAAPPSRVTAVVDATAGGRSVLFPFVGPTPAAAFERAGLLHLVFETRDELALAALRDPAGLGPSLADDTIADGLAVLRLRLPANEPARLVPEGTAWRLRLGGGAPPDALRIDRAVDAVGQPLVAVGLAGAAATRWLSGPDGTVAVVPSVGRAQAVAGARRFVEFDLPVTLHGLAVESRTDDLTVTAGQAGILIGRATGLQLSAAAPAGEAVAPDTALVLERESWNRDRTGLVRERSRELLEEAVAAPRTARAVPRARLARLLLANGLAPEAAAVLALASSEDGTFATRPDTLLLSGIAALGANRLREARAFLTAEALADEREAVLWRGMLDVRENRPGPALAAFARVPDILKRYPDEVTGSIRLAALGAALRVGDGRRAEAELAALDRLPVGSLAGDELDLARARVDEATGRADAALASFERLVDEGSRPVAAMAVLRAAMLGLRSGRLPAAEAMRRLEGLAVTWRGDETELATLAELAELYGQAGRWRDVFATARLADGRFADSELSRSLHATSVRLFEELLLDHKGGKLSAVETLTLYYDFKEFAPIGRRGDEVVRRLADKLVELDLLPQAAELLQHQVDRRLSGGARAAVAARLAAVRLLAGEPSKALAALAASRLPDLPADLRRLRLLIQAKAEADLSRTDLALEIVAGETGEEFRRLGAEILFAAQRWQAAGEASEALVGRRWQEGPGLTDRERSDVLRAAVAFQLGDDRIGLGRLRAKFGPRMADSPQAKTFEILGRPDALATREFRALALEAGRADTLRDLLADIGRRGEPMGNAAPPDPTAGGAPPA